LILRHTLKMVSPTKHPDKITLLCKTNLFQPCNPFWFKMQNIKYNRMACTLLQGCKSANPLLLRFCAITGPICIKSCPFRPKAYPLISIPLLSGRRIAVHSPTSIAASDERFAPKISLSNSTRRGKSSFWIGLALARMNYICRKLYNSSGSGILIHKIQFQIDLSALQVLHPVSQFLHLQNLQGFF
jgi:hypothetical protein